MSTETLVSSKLGQDTIRFKQTQTAKFLALSKPCQQNTFGSKQTPDRVPFALSKPRQQNLLARRKPCQHKNLVPSKLRQDIIRSKQTQTAENLGSTQTMPTETFFSSKLTTVDPI
jgi:hypothetical protein